MPQLSAKTQELVLRFCNDVLTEHKKHEDYYLKMEAIDIAFARYIASRDPKTGEVQGEGIDAATVHTGVFNVPSTVPPIVVSQVESMVGYLSEVFLSGSPLFPIVSNPANSQAASALEALLDNHSTLGGYPRELLIFLRDAVKYNLAALETDWSSVDQYDTLDELIMPDVPAVRETKVHFTKLRRLDLYNTVWDRNVAPGNIARDGDYAGYIEILSKPKLKRLLNKFSQEQEVQNVPQAMKSYISQDAPNYRIHPQISDYVSARKPVGGIDWAAFLGFSEEEKATGFAGNYEVFTLYARLCPDDIKFPGPKQNHPQVFKIVIVNGNIVVQVKRIISAYDYLPILFGQPQEDGLGYQTKSIAEGGIPIQQAAGTLFNIRFNSARRAVADRALYNPSVIAMKDVNSPVPAAKIPVKTNSLGNTRISDHYHSIPYDSRGTETAMQDAMAIVAFGKELSGLNNPMQGQFQKGNKSVQEWNDTMGGADARLRLPALALEYQFFAPLKEILKFNIYQYGKDSVVTSQKTGKEVAVQIAALRQQILSFRVADGYTPKSKLAGTDALIQSMTMISQNQLLAQQFGPLLPQMMLHIMQLLGIRDLPEYIPQNPQQQTQGQTDEPA